MKRMIKLLGVTLAIAAILTVALAATVSAAGPMGPAPNSGDCIPDGSGFESPIGPNTDTGSGKGPVGPAPNAGDCIPDGSGF